MNCLEICTMRRLGKEFSCLEMIPLHLGLSAIIVQLVSQEYMSSLQQPYLRVYMTNEVGNAQPHEAQCKLNCTPIFGIEGNLCK